MNRGKKLFKNTIIISIGKACTQLITFILLPLYTGVLSTDEYGIVDLLNTLVFLIAPIITFQIEQAIFRNLIEARSDEEKTKKIISSGIITVFFQIVLFLIVFLIISPLIRNEYKYFLTANVITYIISSIFLQISRGLGDNKKYSLGSFLNAFFTIIFNVLFLVAIKLRVTGMLLGTLLGHIVCMVFLFISLKLYKYISFKSYDKKLVKKLLKYSVPLIPNAISWWVFGSSDRLIVSTSLGLSMNGILSASSKFSGVYTTCFNVFDIGWTESIALHIKDADIEDYFNKTLNTILKLFFSLAIAIISFMPFVYPIMINKNYAFGYNLVPILIFGAFFNVLQGLIAAIYAGKKDTKSIAKTSIIAAILNIIIHISLLKVIGLYAAAVSTLASFIIIALYRLYDVNKRYLKIRIERKFIISSFIITLIIIPLYYMNNLYLNILSILLFIVCSIFINKNLIQIIYKAITSKLKKGD